MVAIFVGKRRSVACLAVAIIIFFFFSFLEADKQVNACLSNEIINIKKFVFKVVDREFYWGMNFIDIANQNMDFNLKRALYKSFALEGSGQPLFSFYKSSFIFLEKDKLLKNNSNFDDDFIMKTLIDAQDGLSFVYNDNLSPVLFFTKLIDSEHQLRVAMIVDIISFYSFLLSEIDNESLNLSLFYKSKPIVLNDKLSQLESDILANIYHENSEYNVNVSGSFFTNNKSIFLISKSPDFILDFVLSFKPVYLNSEFMRIFISVVFANCVIASIFLILFYIFYRLISLDIERIVKIVHSSGHDIENQAQMSSSFYYIIPSIRSLAILAFKIRDDLRLMRLETENALLQRDGAIELKGDALKIANDANFCCSKSIADLAEIRLLKKIFEDQIEHLSGKLDSIKKIDRQKSELLANIGHEIKTPLNAIVGFSELIMYKSVSEQTKLEYLKIICESSHYMSKLIGDIMDFSRSEFCNMSLNESWVSLSRLIKSSVDMSKATKGQAKFNINYVLPEKEISLFVDEIKMRQVIINLLSNAIKFSSPNRAHLVEICCKLLEKSIVINISDNGIGIPSDDISSVVGMFSQSCNAMESNDGIGLGLSLVQRIVSMHGGTMGIKSVIDEGTIVTVEIPIDRVRKNNSNQNKVYNEFIEA